MGELEILPKKEEALIKFTMKQEEVRVKCHRVSKAIFIVEIESL